MCFSSYKNRNFTVKLWWVGACEKKKRAFFVPLILSEGIHFNICVLSQWIVYWIHFQNIHTFMYQKTLLYTLFCLFLKSSKASSVSLTLETKFGDVPKAAKVLVLWFRDIFNLIWKQNELIQKKFLLLKTSSCP